MDPRRERREDSVPMPRGPIDAVVQSASDSTEEALTAAEQIARDQACDEYCRYMITLMGPHYTNRFFGSD